MKYIAYGSNMVQEQMAVRCPDARLIGTGYIAGARLEFYLHATVKKTGDQRNRVPVAVWEINDRDERRIPQLLHQGALARAHVGRLSNRRHDLHHEDDSTVAAP